MHEVNNKTELKQMDPELNSIGNIGPILSPPHQLP